MEPGDSLAQQLVLHCLLAEQTLQFADLHLKRAVVGCGHNLLVGRNGRECALGHQPSPGEQLVALDAVRRATSDTEFPGE